MLPLRAVRVATGLAVALASLWAATLGATMMALVNTATVTVIAFLLLRGGRRRDVLHRTRMLLLAALGAVFVAGLMPVVYHQIVGRAPASPWAGDVVALCYIPLCVAGLLAVPRWSRRRGHGARALADALLAASSLWYLLGTISGGTHSGISPLGTSAIGLAYPVGDVFVLSAALCVLGRCAPAAARFVGGIAVGLVLIAANDIWLYFRPATAVGAILYQLGLVALVAAASSPPVKITNHSGQRPWLSHALGTAPFFPLLVCMTLTTHMVVNGDDMRSGQVLPALVVATALTLRQLAGSRDKQRLLTELQARERGLRAELRLDDLTGLANRLGATEALQSALTDAAHQPVTVVLLDLNEFKLINDNHGHAVGDEVLREIGVRLVDAVAQSGTAARLGGDEFMVVSAALDEPSREDLIRRITLMFDSPIEVGRQRFIVSASIGVVTGHHPDSGEQLLADADAAMYQAKEGSARAVATVVLDVAGRSESSRQLRIREAIARPDVNHFAVMYQPVIDLTTGHIVGVEALLRWRHPDLGPVSPEVFIALAERAGSIDVLGDFVLRQATRDLADLHLRHPGRDLTVGINVSPRQLGDASFADRALGIIEAAGLQPRHVTIEITEQAFEADLAPVRAGVDQLVAAGADVAVDDFGTGYSSLRYLQRLRLTVMKIDRDFVADIGHEAAATRLVASLTAMAATLDLSVVAEGIETFEQLGVLRGLNCRYGQGYLFSPPVPIEQIGELLAANHAYPLELGDRRLSHQREIRAVAPMDVIHSSVSGSSNDLKVVNR